MHSDEYIARIMNAPSEELTVEEQKAKFIHTHLTVIGLDAELRDYRAERKAAAMALRAQDIKVVDGFRIEMRTEWALPEGYEDSESPAIAELDAEIAAVKRYLKGLEGKRKAASDIQIQRCRDAGTARVADVSISVREVA